MLSAKLQLRCWHLNRLRTWSSMRYKPLHFVRRAPSVPLVQFVSALSPSPMIPFTLDVQPSRCPVHQQEPYLSPSPPHPAAPPPPLRLLATHTQRLIKILRIPHASRPIPANTLTSILIGITAKNDAESSMGASL